MRKKLITVILLFCSLWFVVSIIGQGRNDETKEIYEYLESRYGSQEFQVEKQGEGEEVSYKVVPANYPEVTFLVEAGEIEESMSYDYHDDFAAQMLYGGAERLGISYEKGTKGYDILVTYESFADLEDLGEKLEKLVTDCRDSKAFSEIDNTCMITVKPEAETNPYFPGYEILITTDDPYTVSEDFGVKDSDLEAGSLAGELKRCHIYYAYTYTIPTDSDMFSDKDIENYKASCTGAMCEKADGSTAVYELANKPDYDLSFGGAYQILSEEGLVTETSKDSFTAKGNGFTIRFTREFTESGVSVVCEVLEGADKMDEDTLEYISDSDGAEYAVEQLIGTLVSFTTPEKIEAKEEAERAERLPLVQEAFNEAAESGTSVLAGEAEITLLEIEQVETLRGKLYGIMESDEDEVWCTVTLKIKNTGSQKLDLFSTFSFGRDNEISAVVADKEANLYSAIEIINMDLDDIYGESLDAGQEIEGKIYFKLPRDLIKDNSLVLMIFCGAESASWLIN